MEREAVSVTDKQGNVFIVPLPAGARSDTWADKLESELNIEVGSNLFTISVAELRKRVKNGDF